MTGKEKRNMLFAFLFLGVVLTIGLLLQYYDVPKNGILGNVMKG